MAFTPKTAPYSGKINAVTLGTGDNAVVIGGQNVLPFYTFDAAIENAPKIGVEVSDLAASWTTKGLTDFYAGCTTMADYAKRAETMEGCDFIALNFESADPNGANRPVAECVADAKAVAEVVTKPIVVMGCKNMEKDGELFAKISEALQGKNILVMSAKNEDYKTVGASVALAYGQKVGVEIFVKNGKYGVMKDGRITCQACFERMERLQGNYLLMGIYPYQVFRNKRTVIDHEGKDLKATLYGQVEQYGDFFKGKDLDGRTIYWDAKGGRSYPTLPQIIRAGRLELIKLGERYRPRQQECMLPTDCTKEEIYIGDQVTIMGDQLIVRMDLKKPYKIYGYLNNGILVGNSTGTFKSDYYLIAPDGHRVIDYQRLPWNTSKQPDLRRLKLKRLE